ncbi:hypothetical protein BDN70DRAFT_934503 [Pholiota conissans]|uniref:F-box domain-containing protein n=1 Tax=Pholiota conissans TaxID=109636 RepID=A0A9P6CYY0_9AGAR|nr:hypothetical protein BDN70DRAFT_934503 [Pholiota conissans]
MSILLALPQEIKTKILSNLNAVSLIRTSMTCKSLYETFQEYAIFEYIIQLHLDGLKESGSNTSTSYPELLQKLVSQRQTWMSVDSIPFFPLATGFSSSRAFAQGVLASKRPGGIDILWLATPNTTQRKVWRNLRDVPFGNLAIDPAQDLLILAHSEGGNNGLASMSQHYFINIHIHSLSRGGIHPLAHQSPLVARFSGAFYESIGITAIHSIKIGGNVVAFHFDVSSDHINEQSRIMIWDWMTSELILNSDIMFDRTLEPDLFSFGLLDSTSFFVTSTRRSGSIRLYKLVRSNSTKVPAIHVATLHLPPIIHNAQLRSITVARVAPIEMNSLSGRPFIINDEDRIHGFSVKYMTVVSDYNVNTEAFLFVHQRTFSRYLSQNVPLKHRPLNVKWPVWGPNDTALVINADFISLERTNCCMYGQRIVLASPIPDMFPTMSASFRLLDFSRSAILSATSTLRSTKLPSLGTGWTLFSSHEIRVHETSVFQTDVKTSLPFVSCVRDVRSEGTFEGYILYSDGIVGYHMAPQQSDRD